MKKMLMFVVFMAVATTSFAGGAGLLVKGVMKTWEEVAKVALKVSGRVATDDVVKAAAKTLEQTSSKYGDDVARASMRGGMEVAEQVAKHGGRFAGLVKSVAHTSDAALRTMALNGDKAVRICAANGEGVVRAIAKLPAEDGTRLLGAIDRNPQVARELMVGAEKGGKAFLDRLFELNGRQILAGTLGAAAIVGVVRKTAPDAAEGEAIERQTEMATGLLESGKPLTEDQQKVVDDWSKTTNDSRSTGNWGNLAIGVILSIFAGISLLVLSFRAVKTRQHHAAVVRRGPQGKEQRRHPRAVKRLSVRVYAQGYEVPKRDTPRDVKKLMFTMSCSDHWTRQMEPAVRLYWNKNVGDPRIDVVPPPSPVCWP